MEPYEIHVLNNDKDLEQFKGDKQIPDSATILLMKDYAVKTMIKRLEAAIEGKPVLIAFVVK